MTKKALEQYVYLTDTDLPALPSLSELALIRKGLRKKTCPNLESLPDEYEYAGVGKFKKIDLQGLLGFQWQLSGADPKEFTFDELCHSPQRELARLEFGWLIADFAALDGQRYLSQLRPISYEDYHQDQYNRQYDREKTHYRGIVNEWRHWAVVAAGHMKFA